MSPYLLSIAVTERFDRKFVAAPIALVAVAHVDPIGDGERIVAFAIGAEDAGIDIVNPIAEMFVQVFVEVVVPVDGARIEDREVVRFLVVLQCSASACGRPASRGARPAGNGPSSRRRTSGRPCGGPAPSRRAASSPTCRARVRRRPRRCSLHSPPAPCFSGR